MSDSVPHNERLPEKIKPEEAEQKARERYHQQWPVIEFTKPEFYFRLGVLICSMIFFVEACGSPFENGMIIQGASIVLAALFVLTMAFQWRVLGDWRTGGNQLILVLLLATLVIPLCGIMTPSLNELPVSQSTNTIIQKAFSDFYSIPGVGQVIQFGHGIIVFLLFLISMIVLIINMEGSRRAALSILALLYSTILLFLYPTVETIMGLLFLLFFIKIQWEKPLLIPHKLMPHLKTIQLEYLRELVTEGSLSTGETKVYLNQNPMYFQELLEFQLVEVDSIAREVIPGKRLLTDPSMNMMERFAAYTKRGLWILAGLIYFVMPDMIPFYFDDAIILMIASGAGFNWIKTLFGESRSKRSHRRERY